MMRHAVQCDDVWRGSPRNGQVLKLYANPLQNIHTQRGEISNKEGLLVVKETCRIFTRTWNENICYGNCPIAIMVTAKENKVSLMSVLFERQPRGHLPVNCPTPSIKIHSIHYLHVFSLFLVIRVHFFSSTSSLSAQAESLIQKAKRKPTNQQPNACSPLAKAQTLFKENQTPSRFDFRHIPPFQTSVVRRSHCEDIGNS
jgi:hypothetical protein